MIITFYLSMVLVTAGVEALICYTADVRYNVWKGLLASILWPVTYSAIIFIVPVLQRREARRK